MFFLFKDDTDTLEAVICGILIFLAWICLALDWFELACLLLPAAYVIGGYKSAKEGLTTLWQEKQLDVDLLMIVAALGAAILGIWQQQYNFILDGAILILIFSISGALESHAMARTERSIRSLMSLTSDTARVITSGIEETKEVESLNIGELILVKPGELIPVDGLILEGETSVNESAITGESIPVQKIPGDEVFAGTLNGKGVLKLEVHKTAQSTLIARIIRLVEEAQNKVPDSQRFIEKLEKGYAQAIVVVGLLLGIVPPFLLNWTWETTIYRALIFLVVASPCALMASIMPTLLSGMANGASQGILFKNGAQLETIGKIKAIAFDKTGTLTLGQLEVVDVVTKDCEFDYLLQIASSLESVSEHPIAEAIVQYAQAREIKPLQAVNSVAYPGQGIVGEIEGQKAIAGNLSFIQKQLEFDLTDLEKRAEQLEKAGKTVVWIAYQKQVLGIIAVADTIRPEAFEVVSHLKKLGIEHIVLLTGDNQKTAQGIAKEVGITDIYAELLPEDKLDIVKSLIKKYGTVAMVGDGINDAPALAQASVGIAMGTSGSDVALESADVILMSDHLDKLEVAIQLGRRSQTVVKQNIIFALGFIIFLLIANFTRGITLPLGVVGHEGSTVLVTLSGLRLLRR